MKFQVALTILILAACHAEQQHLRDFTPSEEGPRVSFFPTVNHFETFPKSAYGIFPIGNRFYQSVRSPVRGYPSSVGSPAVLPVRTHAGPFPTPVVKSVEAKPEPQVTPVVYTSGFGYPHPQFYHAPIYPTVHYTPSFRFAQPVVSPQVGYNPLVHTFAQPILQAN